MKKSFFLALFGFLFVAFAAFKLCSIDEPQKTTVTVQTPEIKNTFEPQTNVLHEKLPFVTNVSKNQPESKSVADLALLERLKDYEKQISELREAFLNKDCNEKIALFDDLNTLRAFNSEFEDNHLLLNVSGIVQGYVHELTPSYTIKPQNIDLELPKPKIKSKSIYAFGTFGTDTQINHVTYGAGIALTNRKNLYQVQLQNINNTNYASASVGIPLLSW